MAGGVKSSSAGSEAGLKPHEAIIKSIATRPRARRGITLTLNPSPLKKEGLRSVLKLPSPLVGESGSALFADHSRNEVEAAKGLGVRVASQNTVPAPTNMTPITSTFVNS